LLCREDLFFSIKTALGRVSNFARYGKDMDEQDCELGGVSKFRRMKNVLRGGVGWVVDEWACE